MGGEGDWMDTLPFSNLKMAGISEMETGIKDEATVVLKAKNNRMGTSGRKKAKSRMTSYFPLIS